MCSHVLQYFCLLWTKKHGSVEKGLRIFIAMFIYKHLRIKINTLTSKNTARNHCSIDCAYGTWSSPIDPPKQNNEWRYSAAMQIAAIFVKVFLLRGKRRCCRRFLARIHALSPISGANSCVVADFWREFTRCRESLANVLQSFRKCREQSTLCKQLTGKGWCHEVSCVLYTEVLFHSKVDAASLHWGIRIPL